MNFVDIIYFFLKNEQSYINIRNKYINIFKYYQFFHKIISLGTTKKII